MKKKISLSVIIILILILGIIVYIIIDEHRYDNRSDEEYIAILQDNIEDFEYIAVTMQQWEKGYLSFRSRMPDSGEEVEIDSTFFTNNGEIANEIENNAEFYNHLVSLRELREITLIRVKMDGDMIEFAFGKSPCNYSIFLRYVDNVADFEEKELSDGGPIPITIIDEHWVLDVFPNT